MTLAQSSLVAADRRGRVRERDANFEDPQPEEQKDSRARRRRYSRSSSRSSSPSRRHSPSPPRRRRRERSPPRRRSSRRSPSWERHGEDPDYEEADRGYRRSDYDEGDRGSRRGREPTSSVHVKKIPLHKDETHLSALFGGYPGITQVRVMRDRQTGESRGFGFVDFDTMENAQNLMESEARWQQVLDGQKLFLDYSYGLPMSGAGGGPSVPAQDWICTECQAVNFSRRTDCFQCSIARDPNAAVVSVEPEGPSHILKASNLEPHTTDQMLHLAMSVFSPVRDVRMVLNKSTGETRGFAFVHFYSVAEATRVMEVMQGKPLDGQRAPLRLMFARDKPSDRGAGAAARVKPPDPVQAAKVEQQYASWQPKEFADNEPQQTSALPWSKEAQQQGQPQQQPQAQAQGQEAHQSQQQPGQQAQQEAGEQQQAQQPSAGSQEQGQQSNGHQQGQEGGVGFKFDSKSGYWYDEASGYYYDANSGMYYHPSTQKWYQQDSKTGQFSEVPEDGSSNDAQSAIAATNAALQKQREAGTSQPLAAPAPAAVQEQQAAQKRKGAVIGSAPVLSSSGLLAAARAAEEKAAQEAAAMRRAKQLEAQEQAAAKKRAFQQEPPPGAGLGFAQPPQQRTQQQQQRPQLPWQQQAPGPQGQLQGYHQGLPPNHHQMQQQQQAPFRQQQMMHQQPPQAMGLPPAGFGSPHQPAPGVQGIVHQGRWSRRG